MPACAPKNSPEALERRLADLKLFFDGKTIKDVDGKERNVGNIINRSYGEANSDMGAEMFEEIVWRSTYQPASSYITFKDSDFRRIANEIEKEAKKLDNPKLSYLEKFGFVKRGVMRKYAVTNWFNKRIDMVSNHERTKYSSFAQHNRLISSLLRKEAIERGGQNITYMGIKASRELDKLESKLFESLYDLKQAKEIFESTVVEREAKANDVRRKIMDVLEKESGGVLIDFLDYMHTRPQQGVVRIQTGPNKGSEYSSNIRRAGETARGLLNDMGGVFINGLQRHKLVITEAYLKSSLKKAPPSSIKDRVLNYHKKINEEIASIKKGMEAGMYFPHYLMEGMVKLNTLVDKISSNPKEEYIDQLERVYTDMRENLGKSPLHTRQRKKLAYDNWIKNPLAVLRKYSLDAIFFNKGQHLKHYFERALRSMPFDAEAAIGMRSYLEDVYKTAEKGYSDRPDWVNKTTRVLTGYEFFSKIGFGVGVAARNLMSGMYFIQGFGNRELFKFMSRWNNSAFDHIKEKVTSLEKEQGFRFADLAEELYTEGIVPTKGVRDSDIDITIGEDGKTQFIYNKDGAWKTIDSSLSYVTGKSAIFQRLSENLLRKYMFRASFMNKYIELETTGKLKSGQITNIAKYHALDMVNKYAFEYAAHQKAEIIGGTHKDFGAVGQVLFQFMHFPMSFMQMQSEILRNSKDAIVARQWKNPDTYIPIRFAALAGVTALASGVLNRDFTRIMENDTLDRIRDIVAVVGGEKDAKGRGFMGPVAGDLFFYATLSEWISLPDSKIVDLIAGYNNAYQMTDQQKTARLWSTLNVEASKIVNKDIPLIRSGRGGSILMHELGLYPRSWTKELHKKIFGKYAIKGKRGKEKTKEEKLKERQKKQDLELGKLYRSMESFAKGGQFITKGPKAIIVGDNPSGREKVTVEPLGKIPRSKGPAKYNKFDMGNLDMALNELSRTEKEESEIYSAKNNRKMTLSDEVY